MASKANPTPEAEEPTRGLSAEFFEALRSESGLLHPLLERVKKDHTLCMELRQDYINIYYRGGNLLEVRRSGEKYKTSFNRSYQTSGATLRLPKDWILKPSDVAAWLDAFPAMKQQMDFHLSGKKAEEREIQQLILRDNNFGRLANDTDYYVCDIEYPLVPSGPKTDKKEGRVDVIAVHWPSTSAARRSQTSLRRLVIAEVKAGDSALAMKSGLHEHVRDVNNFLSGNADVKNLKRAMEEVFRQKLALGLIPGLKSPVRFSDERPLLLLVLVNHKPASTKLHNLLATLPPSPNAELQVAAGSLLGYGLYDHAMLTVDQARSRLKGHA